MKKLVPIVLVLGVILLVAFVYTHPNPNRDKLSSFQIVKAENMPVSDVSFAKITLKNEWRAAYPTKPQLVWGSHVTQSINKGHEDSLIDRILKKLSGGLISEKRTHKTKPDV